MEEIEETQFIFLKKICCYNIDRIVIGHILVNSIRNKFEMLSNIVKNKIDTLMLSKIKPSYLTGIHSIQGLVATARHGVTRKKKKKRKKERRMFRKNPQIKGVW